jgi:hypothetical protein
VEKDGFTVVSRKKPAPNNNTQSSTGGNRRNTADLTGVRSRVNILGAKAMTSNCAVKSGINLIKKSVLLVDNLVADCSVEDLKSFLSSMNVTMLSCFPAKSWLRGEARDHVCAYRVCIDAADKDTVCCELYWPQGVIVRDWVFLKTNQQNGGSN